MSHRKVHPVLLTMEKGKLHEHHGRLMKAIVESRNVDLDQKLLDELDDVESLLPKS